MANRFRGEVPVEVDGETYTLRFTTNNLVMLEDALGFSLTELTDEPSLKQVRTIAWAGFGGEMSEEEVGDLIDAAGLTMLTQKITDAFAAVFDSSEGQAEGKPQKGSTGKKR